MTIDLVPNRFLVRVCHPVSYLTGIPDDEEDLFHLPESCRLNNFAEMDGQSNFADIRVAWNEGGLAFEVEVRGKQQPVMGDATKPRLSDGLSLWIDTRDTRTSHRATRFCHQFHFLPTGGVPDGDEPVFVQHKINRALLDAPLASADVVGFRSQIMASGYRMAIFLPAESLHGFDPEQNPRLGLFYLVRDGELGEQSLGAATELPISDDPSLWSLIELVDSRAK